MLQGLKVHPWRSCKLSNLPASDNLPGGERTIERLRPSKITYWHFCLCTHHRYSSYQIRGKQSAHIHSPKRPGMRSHTLLLVVGYIAYLFVYTDTHLQNQHRPPFQGVDRQYCYRRPPKPPGAPFHTAPLIMSQCQCQFRPRSEARY